MSQHRKMQSQSTFARVQMYSTRDWLAYFCAHLHALCWLGVCVASVLLRIVSPRHIGLMYVCILSRCAQSWPEGQTDAVNTSQSPWRTGPPHKRKNTLFALEINRCITSHLRPLEAPTVLSPRRGFWPQLSDHLGMHPSLLRPFRPMTPHRFK